MKTVNIKREFDTSIELKDNAMLKVRPELFNEWDFEKNDELGLDIYKMTKGQGIKAWWTCSKCDSSYFSILKDRAKGINCPYCRGLKVNHTNSLDSISPELASQWHPTKNEELTPHDVTYGSNKKVWWLGNCGHEWEDSVSHRRQGRGCSYCASKSINSTNSLYFINPSLASEWHPTLNSDLTPHDVPPYSSKKVWWKCDLGHEWESRISVRNQKIGCPYFSGKRVLKGFNDMWTTNPKLATLLLNPEDGHKYFQGSKVKVDWKCECGEIIKGKTISSVNNQRLPCVKCTNGLSYPEKIMYYLLKELDIDFIREKTFSWSKKKRYDFHFLYSTNEQSDSEEILIETHGGQHYRDVYRKGARNLKEEQENDKYKYELAMKNGIDEYIVIDCRQSNFKFIKNNIINSRLGEMFDLSGVDWDSIKTNSQKSFNKYILELHKNGVTANMIADMVKISYSAVLRVLKKYEVTTTTIDIPITHKNEVVTTFNHIEEESNNLNDEPNTNSSIGNFF